jgi:hypothetical protein
VRPRGLSRDYDIPVDIVDKSSLAVERKTKTASKSAERPVRRNDTDYDVPTAHSQPKSRAVNTNNIPAEGRSSRRELPRPPRTSAVPDNQQSQQQYANKQRQTSAPGTARTQLERRMENRDSVIDDYDIPRNRTMIADKSAVQQKVVASTTSQHHKLPAGVCSSSSGQLQEVQHELLNTVTKIKLNVGRYIVD